MIRDKKKIILITLSPKTHRTSEENLGIAYLKSALTRDGYEVEIIDGWLGELDNNDIYNYLVNIKDDILFIGFSSYMMNTKPTIDLIDRLKKYDSNIKIVCGGFGPTFYPKEYLRKGTDYIIKGEGEQAICQLASCISKNVLPKNVNNVGYIDNENIVINKMGCLIEDLDTIEFPARDTIDIVLKKKSTVNMVTSRGCSGNCDFCSVIAFFRMSDGRIWRTRSINNIVDEIENLYKRGVSHIKMVDDSFIDGIRDEKWCNDFANEIEKRNIRVKMRGQIRADKITDSILKDLKRAGFFSFACGIENGSQSALTRMNKSSSILDNEKALDLLKKHNYLVQMGFILFDKFTTMKELEENYRFLEKYKYTVTKGIFSEMYSAEGTILNNKLRNASDLIESNFIENNNKYNINEKDVYKTYYALKKWHKSHSAIYDMTIDPLTAPKSISDDGYNDFYELVMQLKEKDLQVFYELLQYVDSIKDMDEYIYERIKTEMDFYLNINEHTKRLYLKHDLIYNADNNPFI